MSSKLKFWMPCYDKAVAEMMINRGYELVVDPKASWDFLVMGGGADVHPILYGQPHMPCTYVNPRRDTIEIGAFKIAGGKPKVGICRGGQMLNVMSGGRMWQDVTNHTKPHDVQVDIPGGTKGVVLMNSTHHQMMIPSIKAHVIGRANVCTRKTGPVFSRYLNKENPNLWEDHEILWYPTTKSLCFQPHPEYSEAESYGFRDIFFELLDKYIEPNVYKGL